MSSYILLSIKNNIIVHLDYDYFCRLANPEATYTQNGFSIHRNDAYGSYPIVAEGTYNVIS